VELHKCLGEELAKQPEEAKALLGFVSTATKFAEAHRDVIAKWVSR